MSEMDFNTDAQWWKPEFAANRHERVIAVVKRIRNRQVHWRKYDLLHAHMYGNLPIMGFGPHQYGVLEPDDGRLQLNIVKSKVDTYQSLICRSKPKPMFLSSGGDSGWSMKHRAKGLSRWVEGKFAELDFYNSIAPLCVLDTGIFDFGVAKISVVNAEDPELADVLVERAFPWEMVFDDAEALAGVPRCLYQRKWIDRAVLAEMFPKSVGKIREAPRTFDEDDWGRDDTSDQVLVTEAWHLPSAPGAKDGRRCMVIGNATLADEPWESHRFPFVFLHRQKPPFGLRGISIARELRPIQIAINQMLLDVQDSVATMARPHWLAPRSANMELEHIDDDIGSIWQYDGPVPPTAYVGQVIPQDVYNHIWKLDQKADDIIGISPFRSTGVVPPNLKSGKAIELNNDVQDGRFLIASQLYEQFAAVDIPEAMIECAREVVKVRPDYAARLPTKKYFEFIRFSDVDMERDEYVMKPEPVSALASLPSDRLDQVQDLFDRGILGEGPAAISAYRRLIDWPDLESETDRLSAYVELTERLIERFLTAEDPEAEGVYIAPEPLWPLDEMMGRVLFAAGQAQLENAPDANVELLRRFVADCQEKLDKAKAAQAPPPPPPGAAPAAPPPPPPGAPPIAA